MNMIKDKEKQREAERFLDELMSHIILAGGSKIEPNELRLRSFGEIVDICFTNGIHLKASAPDRMKDS